MATSTQSETKASRLPTVSLAAGLLAVAAGLAGLVCFGIYYGVLRWTLANGPSGILFFISDAAQRLLMLAVWCVVPVSSIAAMVTGGLSLRQTGQAAGRGARPRALIGIVAGGAVLAFELLAVCGALLRLY